MECSRDIIRSIHFYQRGILLVCRWYLVLFFYLVSSFGIVHTGSRCRGVIFNKRVENKWVR